MEVSEDGFFIEKNGHEYIFYNDIGRSYERQNWTILHEIGHIVLDHTGHSEHEEDEANFFAKYAIAPPILIYKIKAESPWEIYEAFDISLSAAFYAYNYYVSWKNRYDQIKRLTNYERRILTLFMNSACI